jgi:HPt (histidine-containing phosphotransfer) domain-containing protein
MQMPVMDGYTAARTLRAQGVNVPIIALTAHAMKEEEEKTRAAGCSGFIPKPIEIDVLLRTVATAVGGDIPLPTLAPETRASLRTGSIFEKQTKPSTAIDAPDATTKSPRTSPLSRGVEDPRSSTTSKDAGPILSSLPTDDPDFREIVDEFIGRLKTQLGEMESAYEHKELMRVAQLAHWLKGSGGSAGFSDFNNPAKRLEQAAKLENLDEIAASIEELRQLASRVAMPTKSTGITQLKS